MTCKFIKAQSQSNLNNSLPDMVGLVYPSVFMWYKVLGGVK